MVIDDNRRRKGLKETRKKQKEQEKRLKEQFNVVENFEEYVKNISEKTGKTPLEVSSELLNDGYSIVEFDETTGKASLVYESIGFKRGVLPEATKYSEGNLKSFRDLRENFPPVTAGIEWHRDFTAGSGHTVMIDDPKDEHKKEMKVAIEEFERNVYQDQMTIGMDNITDIMVDVMFTEGLSSAEIVYGIDVNFDDYVDHYEPIEMKVVNSETNKETTITTQVPVMKDPDWKTLSGITRLKILDNAYSRLKVYRHPVSGEVLFITLDEKAPEGIYPYWTGSAQYKRTVIKFHPWEIFWLSTNRRGPNLKGISLVQAVYSVAKMVQEIENAVGKGFKRWANTKYFFILGSERRPWNKETQKRFLTSMKQMIQHDYVGFPVPFGFDVKSIGGEGAIFDGKNFLDYLIGLVCAGMQYPREFLEVGRTQAGDKAWIAWRVRYGRNQLQIRRAIEQQLWKRQLWCKFGLTYRISKKGVPVNEQEQRDIYVPKLEWRSEGKWLQQEEIKMLTGILNVANPVNPILKIGVEKKMAETLGIGELDWEDTIHLVELTEQQKVADTEKAAFDSEAKLKAYKDMGKEKLAKLYAEQTECQLSQCQTPEEQAKTKQALQPKTEEQPPLTPEEKLIQQGQKRSEGGVSRTTKETGTSNQKGIAKPLGSTRIPTEETQSILEQLQEIRDTLTKTQADKKESAENLTFQLEKIDWRIEQLKKEQKQPQQPTEVKIIQETKPQELTIKQEPLKSEPVRVEVTTKSEPQKVEITTKSEPTKVDATVKIEGFPEKMIVETKSEPVKVEVTTKSEPVKLDITSKSEPAKVDTTVKIEGIPEKITVETKSEPVKVDVNVATQTPESIEETRQREGAQKELIDKQIELTDKKSLALEEERQEKKRLREKIEDKLEEEDKE